MEPKIEPQLFLEDWAAKSAVAPKPLLAAGTQNGHAGRKWSKNKFPHNKHEAYDCWQSMKNRCYNKRHKDFPYYGGRGITVCERWLDFELFVADIGPRPSRKHSIDRKDTNGNYTPENCRWATKLEQGQNTRHAKKITFQGQTKCLSEWERTLGLPKGILHYRLAAGWSEIQTLTTPRGAKNAIRKNSKSGVLTAE